ncbi:OmpH family outer membrane protein [Aquicoccus porphyridii]|uniref:OmpH family outer membrane protein n=1 Tax=Aquicoccus porphyridii TaxID=1852029 RepID=A0A5A9ZV56_9RHOB|nr:OmpH family outer membrane protein [Aquicoccus porphyridii]KAA0921203.1 OmpH family outer membrane protein [Aquicoccus porphyridii]RAI56847.1 OmpH family outer membrane protein [Rhodobacteraceae bacterium AsT-22]
MGRALRGLILATVAAVICVTPPLARAQDLGLPDSPVLTVDLNRLFNETLFGERVASELEAESAVLAAENRRIEAELTAEEKELTERRDAMTPAAFREAADAFDAKVQRIRAEQEAKARALADENENAQRRFLGAARPVLERLMLESGASVLLDTRAVLLSSDAVNVTDAAVDRIDDAIGDGSGVSPDAEEVAPEVPIAPQEAPPLVLPPEESE